MIYSVQVLFVESAGKVKRTRTWGYFFTFEDAEKVMLNNINDIFEEGYYNFGLINEVPEGILILHKVVEHWYKALYSDDENPEIIPCYKPIPKNIIIGLG